MIETIIPAPKNGVARWRQPYRLGGVAGSLELVWNVVTNGWLFWLYDGNGALLGGPRTVNNRSEDLLAGWHGKNVPPGRLVCRSVKDIPGFLDFQNGAELVYISK